MDECEQTELLIGRPSIGVVPVHSSSASSHLGIDSELIAWCIFRVFSMSLAVSGLFIDPVILHDNGTLESCHFIQSQCMGISEVSQALAIAADSGWHPKAPFQKKVQTIPPTAR